MKQEKWNIELGFEQDVLIQNPSSGLAGVGWRNPCAALLSLVSEREEMVKFSLWVQLLLMPLASPATCSLWNERTWCLNLALLSYSCDTKWALNVALLKQGRGEGILHLKCMVYFIVSLLEFVIGFHAQSRRASWEGYRSVGRQPQCVQPQTKWMFYRGQGFAFQVSTHWCEHRLKITKVALIRILYSRRRYKSFPSDFHRYHWTFRSCLIQKHPKVLWVFHLLYIVKIYYTSEGIWNHWTGLLAS